MSEFSDKVVIITGAVGNLGTATATAFQKAGAHTVLVDRSSDRLKETYPGLANAPEHLLAGDVDLTSADAVSAMVNQTVGKFGRVDVLVNTVGGFKGGKAVHEEDLATWDFLMNLNLRTTLLCCRAVTPAMLRQKNGRMINVASRNAYAGSANYAAYSVAKTAILRLTESLSGELKGSNINVNCILPGTIDTPQNRAAMPSAAEERFVPPEAIADVILFLASNAARMVTGAAIPVFGKG